MTKRLVFLVFLCFFFSSCYQPAKKTRSEIIKQIADAQQASKEINDSSLINLNTANRLIAKLDDAPDSLFIENTFLIGYYYAQKREVDSASKYFHNTFNLINSTNHRARDLSYFRYASGFDFGNGNYANAISKANSYLNLLDKNSDFKEKVFVNNLFERVYIELKDYEKALYYNQKCIEVSEKAHDTIMLSVSQISKAKYLYNHFNDKKGAYNLLDSIITLKGGIDNHSKIQLYYERGNLRFRDKRFNAAIRDYDETLHYINNKKGYNDLISKSFINISEAYINLKKKILAQKYLDSASQFVYKNTLSDYFIELPKLRIRLNNIESGNFDEALADVDSIALISNRAYAKRMNEELLALKSSNEREKLLAEQKQEIEINNIKLKSRNLVVSVLAGLLVVIGYIIYRQRKLKFQKQSLQMQQRLLRSQMNPHFMSNTLYAIQNTIKNDQDGSVKYLTKFSRLLRLILENSMHNYVLVEKELESLKKYMDLQLLRFPDKFTYTIDVEDIDEDVITIPPMLMQPFVENSIEHGFFGINYKGHIKIKLSNGKKHLNCIIEDNGVGLKNINNSKKQSASSALISDFIFKATKSKISVLDIDKVDNKESGTRIEFLIPNKILEHD